MRYAVGERMVMLTNVTRLLRLILWPSPCPRQSLVPAIQANNLTTAVLWFCHFNTNTWLKVNFKKLNLSGDKSNVFNWVICKIEQKFPHSNSCNSPQKTIKSYHGLHICLFNSNLQALSVNKWSINKLSALLCQYFNLVRAEDASLYPYSISGLKILTIVLSIELGNESKFSKDDVRWRDWQQETLSSISRLWSLMSTVCIVNLVSCHGPRQTQPG